MKDDQKDNRRLLIIVVGVIGGLLLCVGVGIALNKVLSRNSAARAATQAAATIIDLLPVEPGTPRSPAEETAAAQTLAAQPPEVQTAVAQTASMQTATAQTAAAQTLAAQGAAGQTAAAQTAAARTIIALSATPTWTRSATFTPTRTFTPFPTVTRRPSSSPTLTYTRSRTATPTPSVTLTRSATPTGTVTLLTPTVSFTVTSTATATHTATVTSTPTQTPTATATATPTRVPGACENVLFPLASGRAWVYNANIRGSPYLMEMDSRNVTDRRASVDFWNVTRSVVSSGLVSCSSGALINMPLFLFDLTLDSFLNGDVTAQYLSGLAAPSQAMFEASGWNYSWSGEYLLNGSGTAPFQGNTYTVEFNDSDLIMTCQTAGFEPVTVPAGSFPSALKVVCGYDAPATLGVGGATFTGRVMATTTQWFAPYVGMLRARVDSLSIHYVIYDLIINVTATAELQMYVFP
jgi:hypothetical protein